MKLPKTPKRTLNLQKFVLDNKGDYLQLQKIHVDLFNKVGQKYNDGGMQASFSGMVIIDLLRTISLPGKEKQKLVKKALDLVKQGKA